MDSGQLRPTFKMPRPTGKVTPTLRPRLSLPLLRGRGTASAVDEVPTQVSDLVDFPVHYFGQGNHRKPEPCADAQARVITVCPSEAAVRAGNCVEGFRSTRNPSNPPHKVSCIPFPGGVGLRPAGLMFRKRDLQQWVLVPTETSSTANAVPLLLQGEGFNAPQI